MFQEEVKFYMNRMNVFYKRVQDQIYSSRIPLNCVYAKTKDPVHFNDRLSLEYKPIAQGEVWGNDWDSAWFHVTGNVPAEYAGKELMFLMYIGGEGLIFDADGTPVYGLTGGSVYTNEFFKNNYLLGKDFKTGDKLEFWVEGAANSLFGMVREETKEFRQKHPQGCFTGSLIECSLAVFEREVWALTLDLEVMISLIEGLPENDFRRRRYARIVNRAADVWNENPANSAAAREVLKEIYDVEPSAAMMTVHGVGHAHIDTGWLWPVRETIRKCARTFSSQIALIEQYPEYVFGCSAAQHYAFTKKHYPALYEKIKKAVASGNWEIQGGMWVEADCNLISGESMVRQFLHGKNFFMDEFGVDVKNLWIPDVFGYSAAMPQIIKKSACDYFLTQKLSWCQYNRFPHQTFNWQGIDGSEVLTHFPPENTYNSMIRPKAFMEAQNDYRQADVSGDFMCLFGIGDGGGGPYPELIERGRRCAKLDGAPAFTFGRADKFFDKINKIKDEFPTWKGELYLELHRGTLTTQSRTKRGNRKNEQLLTMTEFLCSMLPADKYPAAELDNAWKVLLLNQFHDIIPGSSIDQVYATTEKEHAEITATCEKLLKEAQEFLFPRTNDSALILNSLSYDYDTVVELPESWNGFTVTDADGKTLPVQHENSKTVLAIHLPKSSLTLIRKGEKAEKAAQTDSTDLVLENDLVRYVFAADASLVEATCKKSGHSLLKPGEAGNVLSLYVDNPTNWDAWDIEAYYPNQTAVHPTAVKARKTVCGDVRSVLEFDLIIGNSTIRQQVVLEAGSPRLDFKTEVDWHEEHKMLRTAFPVNVFSQEATFDIQYGYVKRSMHENTARDFAQFEVAGQRYADVSGLNGGVALLNDCKYGYKVKNSVLDLNLLRSPKHPDSTADQGRQLFTYALLPHCGTVTDSNVMAQAALVNRAPYVMDGCTMGKAPVCTLDSGNVTLEVVKKAEKEDCIIIRMLENKGEAAEAVLNLSADYKVIGTNLMEWTEEEEYKAVDGKVVLNFKPFELKTLKLKA